jgi:glutamate--cysteine ligase regulatory subunit
MHLHNLLNVTHIDTLIVSDNKSTPPIACWKSLEELVKSSQVRKLGVTDLDRNDLEIFLNSGIEIKPVIDHVHVGECCNMPQDLIQLAKEKGIELLHNSDCTGKVFFFF